MNIKLMENGQLPQKMTDNACCYDVFAREVIQESEDFYTVKLGFACTPPKGYKLCLVPRSSLTRTHWIMQNSPGIIDSDYFLEVMMKFRAIPITYGTVEEYEQDDDGDSYLVKYENFVYAKFPYKIGDRVGQIYLQKVEDMTFNVVDEIVQTTNRVGGFGSTNQ